MTSSADKAAWTFLEELFDQTFGSRPSAQNLAVLKKSENERAEVNEFIERALRLMAISKLTPAQRQTTLGNAFVLPPRQREGNF
jgi:hypothetical protein